MLTLGQACCLALGMEPTEDNRKEAKRMVDTCPFGVTYMQDSNPMKPIAMGKDVIKRDPFQFKTYPETPPQSPILLSSDRKHAINYYRLVNILILLL